jgi:hypothetical protein
MFGVYLNLSKHNINIYHFHSGFGGLEIACWPLVPKFARSLPNEASDFRAKNFSGHLPSERN